MPGDEGMTAFSGPPQPVEAFHRGVWYTGELLGWRHEPDGRCRARVRCVVDGLRHSAWMDLADLRLPQPEPRPAPARPGHTPAAATPDEHGRHGTADDATQPHLLLLDRGQRSRPPVPAPRRPEILESSTSLRRA